MTIYQLLLFSFCAALADDQQVNEGAAKICKDLDTDPRKEAIREEINTAYEAFFEHRDFARYDADVKRALHIA